MDGMGICYSDYSNGSDERAWQQCRWLWQRPATPLASLCGSAERIMLLATDPGDEVLGCGGLLKCVAEHTQVRILALTDGEACYAGEPWWTPARLRQARRDEQCEALERVGIGAASIVRLGIADGMLAAHEQALERWLRGTLRPNDLLLAPWRFDGRADHEAAGRAACRAARSVGCARLEYPVWGWHWMDPGCAHMAWESPRLLDIESVIDCKRGAVSLLRTQTGAIEYLRAEPALPSRVLARFQRNHEVFLA